MIGGVGIDNLRCDWCDVIGGVRFVAMRVLASASVWRLEAMRVER